MCELHPRFLLHRGEGQGGEAFTLITLSSNDLRAMGEEVKAKNEKRRTRPRARKMPKMGFFREMERGTYRVGRITLAKRRQAGRTKESLTHFFGHYPTKQNKTRN